MERYHPDLTADAGLLAILEDMCGEVEVLDLSSLDPSCPAVASTEHARIVFVGGVLRPTHIVVRLGDELIIGRGLSETTAIVDAIIREGRRIGDELRRHREVTLCFERLGYALTAAKASMG
jgi:hypothetical protein